MTCPRCSAPADEQTLREFGGVCPKCLLDFSEEQDAPAFPNLEILEMIGQGGMASPSISSRYLPITARISLSLRMSRSFPSTFTSEPA